MIKKIPRKFYLEIANVFVITAIWIAYGKFKHSNSVDLLIDGLLASYFIILLLERSSHPRHFWVGFSCLLATVVSSILEISTFTYVFSSLALGFFTLGVINLLIFNRE